MDNEILLMRDPSIKILDLSDKSIGYYPEKVRDLFTKIQNTQIEVLILQNNNLGLSSLNFFYMQEGLKTLKKIKVLDLRNNGIGLNQRDFDLGLIGLEMDEPTKRMCQIFEYLCESAEIVPSLEKIDIRNNDRIDNLWKSVLNEQLEANCKKNYHSSQQIMKKLEE